LSNYWTKLDSGYWEACADAGLSDAAHLTHAQVIGFLFRLGSEKFVISPAMLRRAATTRNPHAAAAELVEAGFWRGCEEGWEVVHYAEEMRESMASQARRRRANQTSQRAYREAHRG
jgi:hypothetical protein